MRQINRRHFLATSAQTSIAAGVLAAKQTTTGKAATVPTLDRLRIGVIGVGTRGSVHLKSLAAIQQQHGAIEIPSICDAYSDYRDRARDYLHKETGLAPKAYVDYGEMLAHEKLDAVCIATPDHWHAKQALDALSAGLHVYCEKPMTHTVQEALDVLTAWRNSGKVMQVGVQSTSLPIWNTTREMLQQGKLGKVLMFQTEFFRNSAAGQWRTRPLIADMTPKTVDWRRWLGVEAGLTPDLPFDREVFVQWRRFWPFGSGMYTDLFVHRTTSMLKATGLRFPARVVGAGGVYLEYDGRDVPDVATVVADYDEGVQGLVTATMCSSETPIRQMIRGHFGSLVFGNGETFTGVDFVPERPQVTLDSRLRSERIDLPPVRNTTLAHFENWLAAIRNDDPSLCNNTPDLGAAAIVTVSLGTRSYREGKVFFFDQEQMRVLDADESWAQKWEQKSKHRAKPNHVTGWKGGDYGSSLVEPEYMALAGPWKDGKPPQE